MDSSILIGSAIGILIALVLIAVLVVVFRWLWNTTMPDVFGVKELTLAHLHSPFKKSLINRKVADQTNGEWHYMLVVEGRKVG